VVQLVIVSGSHEAGVVQVGVAPLVSQVWPEAQHTAVVPDPHSRAVSQQAVPPRQSSVVAQQAVPQVCVLGQVPAHFPSRPQVRGEMQLVELHLQTAVVPVASQVGVSPPQAGLQPHLPVWVSQAMPVPQDVALHMQVLLTASQSGVLPVHAGVQVEPPSHLPLVVLQVWPPVQEPALHLQVLLAASQTGVAPVQASPQASGV
jgi:hypothetical protein